jgi:Mrp family chromosome partitioning ATPase
MRRFFARRKTGSVDPGRLAGHHAVRDVVARLVAARESLSAAAGTPAGSAFLFTSLRDGQGTSTLAAAVARGLAESGRPTLLAVVADPAGEKALPESVTLSELVAAPRRDARTASSLLTVRVPARFTDVPESAHDVRAWMDGFQVLILDAPPVTDSLTRYWVPRTTGVVLVVDGEEVALKSVLQAREDLERLGGRLVGAVLNRYRSRIPRWMAPYFVYG